MRKKDQRRGRGSEEEGATRKKEPQGGSNEKGATRRERRGEMSFVYPFVDEKHDKIKKKRNEN